MTSAGAKTVVFASGGVLIGLALLSKRDDTFKRVWAAAVWTTLVAVVADLSPDLVAYFSVAVIVGAVAVDQGVLGKFLTGSSSTATPAAGGGTVKLGPSTSSSSTPRASVTQTQGPRVT